MDEQDHDAASTPKEEAGRSVSTSLVGLLKARDVQLRGSAAGLVAANGELSINQGGCGAVIANGGVTIRFGGCGPLIANGDVSIEYGGTQAVLALGQADIRKGSLVGFVGSPRVNIEDGGKVLFGTRQALAFGAAAGVSFALLSRLFRR